MNRKLFLIIILVTIVLWTGLIFVTGRIYNIAFSAVMISRFVNPGDGKMSVMQSATVESSHEEKVKLDTKVGKQTSLQEEASRSENDLGNGVDNDIGDGNGYTAEEVKNLEKADKLGDLESMDKTAEINDAGSPISQEKTGIAVYPNDISLPTEIREVEKQVSISDKIKVLGIVLSRMKPYDIKRLTELGKDGISSSDRELAKEILKSRITAEEKETLKGIYNKYSDLYDKY